ncbi:MAG TPA: pirin family protein [bacterium]|jgi:redox-sensitive bicupin YhaK (pirin superfamily)
MRKVKTIITAKPTLEGAGVRLKRVFGPGEIPNFDPFLLLDHFGSDDPEDYMKGFPWHPHRGIETITYVIRGEVEHGDSIGNTGVIRSGDIQWMTAGSGIIHQEMPRPYDGNMMGFQLWVSLPRVKKMTKPRYMGITKHEIASASLDGANVNVNVIAGSIRDQKGPVKNLFIDVEYYDVHVSGRFAHITEKRTSFIYVYEGAVNIGDKQVASNNCALLEEQGEILVNGSGRFLLVAGDPLNEPIAWGGPIVMNTKTELRQAFQELDEGTFIKGTVPDKIADNFYR